MPEYNAEQACGADKNPTSQVKCLDDFVSKYPNSNLADLRLPDVLPGVLPAEELAEGD